MSSKHFLHESAMMIGTNLWYCSWKKSQTTTQHVWNPVNNGIFTGAGFLPSTVYIHIYIYNLRNVPLILGSKRPGRFHSCKLAQKRTKTLSLCLYVVFLDSRLEKLGAWSMDSAVAQVPGMVIFDLAVVLNPWVHEAHAEDRQGLCPDFRSAGSSPFV